MEPLSPQALRRARLQMVERQLRARGIDDERVLAALGRVPREQFVSAEDAAAAYADHPLPIGFGQTISQPYIVAYMTAAAHPGPGDRCLEIGTGSGYQAAVLAEVCGGLHSVEYLPEVAAAGARNLRAAGYGPERVILRTGDGYHGCADVAPFDVILVTAAPRDVPGPLLEQLALGGRLIIPVGTPESGQRLERWTRLSVGRSPGAFHTEQLLAVRFVPFLGRGAESG